MIEHNMDQGTDEWFAIREMKFTASKAQAIGSAGKGLETLCKELIIEKYTSGVEKFSNEHTERGHELEDSARFAYELERGVTIVQMGFCELDKDTGCSPDGEIKEDKDGIVEIKCLAEKGFIDIVMSKKVPSQYMWQMQMQMWVMNKKWCDFVVYNEHYTDNPLIIIRALRDEKKIDALKEGVAKGIVIRNKMEKDYLKNAKSLT